METLSFKQAEAAAAAVLDAAARDGGRPISVAVVDCSGELIYFARIDGAPARTVRLAINKAYTAAYMERDSGEFGLSLAAARRTLDWYGDARLTGIAGGLPVRKESTTLGAIGVSGRAADKNVELAKAGLAALSRTG
jgi:glc operon protein GlcG